MGLVQTEIDAVHQHEELAHRRVPFPWLRAVPTVLALATLAVVARRPGYLLHQSFWLDEGWVVDSVRAPFGQIKLLTSSTPIGWTLLLRLVPPIGGPERYRLLPVAFGVGTAVAAWALGRRVRPYPWLHGLLAGLAGAASPAVLAHNWLKQYTAEGCIAVALLVLLAWVETSWCPRRLMALGTASVVAFLVSNTAPLVTAGVFGALGLFALAQRAWRRAGQIAAVSLAVGLADAMIYQWAVSSGNNSAMRRYWTSFYIPTDHGYHAAVRFVSRRAADAFGRLGFGPWWLLLALVAVGLFAIWRSGMPATALVPVLIGSELVAAGAGQAYPFLDPRTSMFYTTILAVAAAVGVAAVAAVTFRRLRTVPLGLLALAGVGGLSVPLAAQTASRPIPGLSVRNQVAYVDAHRQPGDAVVVTYGASFSFAYYWPAQPTFQPATGPSAVRFEANFPQDPRLTLVHHPHRNAQTVLKVARSGAQRIWVIVADSAHDGIVAHKAAQQTGTVHTPASDRYPLLITPKEPAAANGDLSHRDHQPHRGARK